VSRCPLCRREGDGLVFERHHLRTKRTDKSLTDHVCRECHKTIHGLFSHRELRDPTLGLDTREGLRKNERFAKALNHIRKVPPGAFMKMKQARRRR
jgi:cytochrome c1